MAAWWVVVSLSASDALAQQDHPAAAAGQEHVWFTTRRAQADDPISLCHCAAGELDAYFRPLMKLTSAPEQMAAWGDRVWLVLPIDPRSETPRREVFTVQVEFEPATGWYFPVPRDRLEVVEPLPGLGKLVAILGTADGPVALLWPNQLDGSGVQGGEGSIAAQPVLGGPKLMQLRNDRWRDLELPKDLQPGQSAALAAGGSDGRTLRLLTDSPDDPARTVVYLRNPDDGSWTAGSIPLAMKRVRSTHLVDDRPLLLLNGDEKSGGLDLAFLRPEGLLPLTHLNEPSGPWAMLGLHDGLRLLEWKGTGPFTYVISRIDPVTGSIDQPQELRQPLAPSGSITNIAILLAGLVAALILVFAARPAVRRSRPLAQGLVPLPITTRLAALAADAAPGALLALLITDSSPSDLLKWPLWTAGLSDGVPFLIMAAITILHVTVVELTKGTTLGKSLMGAKVVCTDGSRVGVWPILLRNLIKCLMLVVPPLAFFAVLNPNLQGVGDLLSHTVVVRSEVEENKGASSDDNQGR